jgi:hypothetical protein
MSLSLRQIKLVLAVGCLFYAIFFGGFSFATGIFENILRQQALESLPISPYHLSGSIPAYDYTDSAMRFCFVSVCFFLFILITREHKKILFEIGALIIVLLAVHQTAVYLIYLGPTYLPTLTGNYDRRILEVLVLSDVFLLGLQLFISILQFVTIWRVYKRPIS